MTSASELFYNRRSRFNSRATHSDLGFDSLCPPDRIYNRRHHNHHDSDACDLLLHRPSSRRHRISLTERAAGIGSEQGGQSGTGNRVVPRVSGNERLPGAVVLARERLLERLRGMPPSETRRRRALHLYRNGPIGDDLAPLDERLSLPPRRNIPLPESPFPQLPPRFNSPSRLIGFLNVSPANSPLRTRLRHDSAELRGVQSRRVRVSSRGAQFGSFSDGSEAQAPSFGEFITSERVKVVAMLALALALCNADRVVMSVAIVPLSLSNGWSRSFAGIVQSSFLWGYLVSPIAGGTLVDYYGGKVVMAWGVALWSMATFLTPWAAETSLWLLLAMRALLGIAEGVALPCMNNMVARWFPKTERSRAVGIAMAGFQLGSSVGLMLSPILMSQGGVFGPFVIFGLSGFLWVLVWLSATSSTPDRSPQISKYELDYIQSGRQKSFLGESKPKTTKVIPPFRRLLSKLPTWAIIVANAMHSWGFFVFLSWMPIYFNSVYHVDLRQAAWFSAVPWTVMAVMGYIGGLWSDVMIRNGTSVTLTRKIMQSIGFLGPGIALVGLTAAKSPSAASAWLTLAVGLKSFSHSGFLVNLQEIAPQYSGVLHGISNTAGTFAAIVGTVGAGFFVELVGSFQGFLLFTSLLYVLAALFYILFSTGERVNFDEPTLV